MIPMINFDYSDKAIKVTTGLISKIFSQELLPLRLEVVKKVSKEVFWSTKVADNMWATFPNNEINDVILYDNDGKVVYKYEWEVMTHGSIFYKSLWLYCQKLLNQGKKPRGLAIGTHDGEFGEWVPIALSKMSDIVLVEGSSKQYEKLRQNYKKYKYTMLNQIVTPNGGEVEYFEGGLGYTNSVVEKVIRDWETEEISSSMKNSISINELIKEEFNGKLDWIHLDIEGLDAKLLMAIKDEYVPKFIIFEDNNFNQEERDEIYTYLKNKGFETYSEMGICMANKN